MRRAVIILNLIDIVAVLITLIVGAAAAREAKNSDTTEDTSDVEKALRGAIFMSIIGWFFSVVSLYGAINFRVVPVFLNAVYLIINFFATGIINTQAAKSHSEFNYTPVNWLISAVVTGLIVYPHVMYLIEVRSGIMSANTYAREKQSCCCV